MKPKVVVSRGPRQGFEKVMFIAKMRKKGTGLVSANGSSMTKIGVFVKTIKKRQYSDNCSKGQHRNKGITDEY